MAILLWIVEAVANTYVRQKFMNDLIQVRTKGKIRFPPIYQYLLLA